MCPLKALCVWLACSAWVLQLSWILIACPHLAVRAHDKRIACEEEFSDSEDEGQGGRRNAANFKRAKRVKTEEEKDGEEKKGEPLRTRFSHLTPLFTHLVHLSHYSSAVSPERPFCFIC